MRATVLALGCLAGISCSHIEYVPLRSAAYAISSANTEPALHGIALDLDLERGTATLVDGDQRVELRLERVTDREQWIGGCGTMSGHSELEPARLAPTPFTLRGRSFAFDLLHADCGSGLRVVESSNHDHRWIFEVAPVPSPRG